jgi:competence protein ComEA
MPKSFLQNYFGFNKQQRNGLFVLIALCFILFVLRLSIPYFVKADPIVIANLPLIEKKLDSSIQKKENRKQDVELNSTLFIFDPNLVSLEQLMQLGLSKKTAETFIKYRAKGFKFKNKEDLLKVYGINEKTYLRLEPYILIPLATKQNDSFGANEYEEKGATTHSKIKKVIELNAADSLALLSLDGIGPSYATRILKYRKLLGGFYDPVQLKEVYGFSEELYQTVKLQINVDPNLIRKIHLNKDDFKSINKHPYLTYELTKLICNSRQKSALGPEDLKKLMNDEALYTKLIPYCVFD